jgi:hypothetical protein
MKWLKVLVALCFLGFAISSYSQTTTGLNASGTAGAQAQGGQSGVNYAPVTTENIAGTRYAASSALAPALTTSSGTCMGSSSMGGGNSFFSLSLGSTWSDEDCKLIKDSSQLWNMGQFKASIVLVCGNDHFRYAISMAGGVQIPGPTKGSYYMVGCPMTEKEWVAAGRPVIDLVTGQPAKLGVLVSPPQPVEPMPEPKNQIVVTSIDPVKQTEFHAIQLEAKQKYGIDLALQEATTQKVQQK